MCVTQKKYYIVCNLTKQVILYVDETVHRQHLKQCINIYTENVVRLILFIVL